MARNGAGGHPARDPNVDRLLKSGAGLQLQKQPMQVRTQTQVTFMGTNAFFQPMLDTEGKVAGYQFLIQDPATMTEYILPFNGPVRDVFVQMLQSLPDIGEDLPAPGEGAQMTIEEILIVEEKGDPLADRFLVNPATEPTADTPKVGNDPHVPMPELPEHEADRG